MSIESRLKLRNVKVISYKDYDEPYIYDPKGDEYYPCVDTMEDWYKNNLLTPPRYVYGTYLESVKLDLDWILEQACEEHYEDIGDNLNGISELREAIDRFNKDNKSTGTYYEDINVIVDTRD